MTESVSGGPGNPRAITVFAVVFAAYVAGAIFSANFFGASAVSAIFPSAGISVASLLLTRRRVWPAVIAAVLLGELLVDLSHGLPLPLAASFALGDVIEPLVAASVVRACIGGTPDLRRTKDLFVYVVGACLFAPLVGGVLEGALGWLREGSPVAATALQWFAGDGISILVVGASILLWPRQSYILKDRPIETVVILAATVVLSLVGFRSDLPPATAVLPALAWAALRLSMLGTALAATVVAFVGNYVNGQHQGLISDLQASDLEKLAVTQLFIAVLVLTALIIAQEVSKRRPVDERNVERWHRLRLESMSALAQQLSAALTAQDIGQTLERQLLDDIGAAEFNLGLLSTDGSRLEWVSGAGSPPVVSPGFAGALLMSEPRVTTDAVRSRQPVLVGSAADYEHRYGPSDWLGVSGAQSLAGWPLMSGADPIGVLMLAWTSPQPFDAEQLTDLSAVASMVSQALVRAQSYADERARALVLHDALHPTVAEKIVGLDYSVLYEPSDFVHGLGGDWYDVMPLPKNRTYMSVGDIIGHGLTAVQDMAQLRSAGRAFAHQGQGPAQLLADLNRFADDVGRGEFATMVVAVFDHRSGSLSYCSAGHPPAFLRRGQTGAVMQLSDANGPALGPLPDATYTEGTVQVYPGDVLVMYTDGLVESGGEAVWDGISRAEQTIAQWATDALLDCRALAEALAPSPRDDDVCLVVVRFGGEEPLD
ncbi:MAG: SpoIIE family protein phosphatase [Mycobacterium sp.]